MSTETYRIRQPECEDLIIAVDLDQASASIQYQGDDPGEWITTPFQTADARHNLVETARLACSYADWPWAEDAVEILSEAEK